MYEHALPPAHHLLLLPLKTLKAACKLRIHGFGLKGVCSSEPFPRTTSLNGQATIHPHGSHWWKEAFSQSLTMHSSIHQCSCSLCSRAALKLDASSPWTRTLMLHSRDDVLGMQLSSLFWSHLTTWHCPHPPLDCSDALWQTPDGPGLVPAEAGGAQALQGLSSWPFRSLTTGSPWVVQAVSSLVSGSFVPHEVRSRMEPRVQGGCQRSCICSSSWSLLNKLRGECRLAHPSLS